MCLECAEIPKSRKMKKKNKKSQAKGPQLTKTPVIVGTVGGAALTAVGGTVLDKYLPVEAANKKVATGVGEIVIAAAGDLIYGGKNKAFDAGVATMAGHGATEIFKGFSQDWLNTQLDKLSNFSRGLFGNNNNQAALNNAASNLANLSNQQKTRTPGVHDIYG